MAVHRAVPAETGFEHAFAAGQPRQLRLQGPRPADGSVVRTTERSPCESGVSTSAPSLARHDSAAPVLAAGSSSRTLAIGSQTTVPAC